MPKAKNICNSFKIEWLNSYQISISLGGKAFTFYSGCDRIDNAVNLKKDGI